MGLHSLSELQLRVNLLTHPPPLTCIRTSLTNLDLSWNQITHIPQAYFQQCSQLNTIIITNNKLSEVPYLGFVAGFLQHIDFTSNNIVDLGLFYGLRYPVLMKVAFTENQLKAVCVPPPVFARRLRLVGLYSNDLITLQLPVGLHDTLLKLENNPWHCDGNLSWHYNDVIMDKIASQITSLTIVYSTVYLSADQSKHQSSASLAFVRGIHRDRWIPNTKGQ